MVVPRVAQRELGFVQISGVFTFILHPIDASLQVVDNELLAELTKVEPGVLRLDLVLPQEPNSAGAYFRRGFKYARRVLPHLGQDGLAVSNLDIKRFQYSPELNTQALYEPFDFLRVVSALVRRSFCAPVDPELQISLLHGHRLAIQLGIFMVHAYEIIAAPVIIMIFSFFKVVINIEILLVAFMSFNAPSRVSALWRLVKVDKLFLKVIVNVGPQIIPRLIEPCLFRCIRLLEVVERRDVRIRERDRRLFGYIKTTQSRK